MARVALLIGTENYGTEFGRLEATPGNVHALAEVLENPLMGGFDSVEKLIDSDHSKMGETIETWLRSRAKDDFLLLYIAGHGVMDLRRKLYFAALSSRKYQDELITSTAVSARNVHEWLQASKAKRQIVILDCCFSGAFGEFVAQDDGSVDVEGALGSEGRVVLTSSKSTQYSFQQQEGKLSVYTNHLIEGIRTGAADLDEDGTISANELHEYICQKMQEESHGMHPQIIVMKNEGYRLKVADTPIRLQYRSNLKKYRAVLDEAINRGYPFGNREAKRLKQLQNAWRLAEADTSKILSEAIANLPPPEKNKGDSGVSPPPKIDKRLKLRNELIAKSGIWNLVSTGIKYNTEDESLRAIQQFAFAHRKELHNAFGIQIEEERIDSLGRMTHSPINVVGKLLREIGFTFHKVGRTGLPKRQYQYRVVYSSTFRFKYATIDQNHEIKKHPRKAYDFRETINKVDFELVQILGGSFEMGSNEKDYEKPIHRVTLPDFFMGKYPVTQAQWNIVANLKQKNRELDPDPSTWKGANRPVEGVSWEDTVEFCNRLSEYTGKTYRLPSEAEWEYACRAGTTTQYHFGEEIDPALANYENNCRCTTKVGRFPGNPWGLFDCHGNIWEWCADVWHPNYNDAPTDGSPRITGANTEDHSGRGGSWASSAGYSRSASRDRYSREGFYLDVVGFRLVLSLTSDSFKPPKSAIPPNPNRF
jgi:formylglycine-generating enzyme required for sulfatase activity/uncharacterized caspase-like protein